MNHILLILALLTGTLTAAEPLRTWTNTENKQIQASFVSLENETVNLTLKNGRPAKVPLNKLSPADQAWIKNKLTPTPEPKTQPTPTQPKTKTAIPTLKNSDLKDLGTTNFPNLPPLPEIPDNVRIPVRDHIAGKTFYTTKEGKDAFPHLHIVGEIHPFSDDLAPIEDRQGDKKIKGYIDRNGKWIIGGDSPNPLPADTERIYPFSEGLAHIYTKTGFAYIDKTGKTIITLPASHSNAGPFVSGLAPVSSNSPMEVLQHKGDYNYIDKTGKIAIEGHWTDATPFTEGIAWVRNPETKKYKRITTTGKILEPEFPSPKQIRAGHFHQNGFLWKHDATTPTATPNGGIYNFSKLAPIATYNYRKNRSDNELTHRLIHLPTMSLYGPELKAMPFSNFSDALIVANFKTGDKNLYGWLNQKGEIAIPPTASKPNSFQEGFVVTTKAYGEDQKDIRIIVLNRQGKIIYKGDPRK